VFEAEVSLKDLREFYSQPKGYLTSNTNTTCKFVMDGFKLSKGVAYNFVEPGMFQF
jgi:hypothetical protein